MIDNDEKYENLLNKHITEKENKICPICNKKMYEHSEGEFSICQTKLTGEMAGV